MTDSRYTGDNALSAGKSISDVTSFSANTPISEVTSLGAAANISAAGKSIQTASAKSGISTMAASATTCYKTAGCPSGYFEEQPSSSFNYKTTSANGKTCYQVTGCGYTWLKYKSGSYSSNNGTLYSGNYTPQNVSCYIECDGISSITVSPTIENSNSGLKHDLRYYLTKAVCKNGTIVTESTGNLLSSVGNRVRVSGSITDSIEMNTSGGSTSHIRCQIRYDGMNFNGTSAYGYASSYVAKEPSSIDSGTPRQEISPCRGHSLDYMVNGGMQCQASMSGQTVSTSFSSLTYNGVTQSGATINMPQPPALPCDGEEIHNQYYYMWADISNTGNKDNNGNAIWKLKVYFNTSSENGSCSSWPFDNFDSITVRVNISGSADNIDMRLYRTCSLETTFNVGGSSYQGMNGRTNIRYIAADGNTSHDLLEGYGGYTMSVRTN